MARIVVAADAVARNRTELQHGLGTIHDKAGMHLDGNLDAVILGEFAVFGPVRNHFFLPLPIEHFQVLRRPGAGHPVRELGVVAVAGTAGEINHYRDAQLGGKLHRALACVRVPLGNGRVGV